MEMTLYEFILGMVGTFFVVVPALVLLFYFLYKEMKEAQTRREEEKNFQNRLVFEVHDIAEKMCCNCFYSQGVCAHCSKNTVRDEKKE